MNCKWITCGFLLLACASAGAQVASHTPTVFSKTPAQSTLLPLAPAGKPVVRVNGSVLTDADLVREEYAIFPYARQHNGIPKDLAPQIRDGALKMIVFEELVYQEALQRKMTIPASRMQQAEADFRKQFATPDEFNSFLKSDFHGSQQLLQEKIRRSLLIESVLKLEVESKGTISPAELKTYYDQNPARFQHPETFTFQTISVLPPANATADQLKEGHARADRALSQAKATKTAEEFGLLAEKLSDDDYRVMMGQHKPVATDQLAPQVVKALWAMKPGAVSEIIQIDQAYTIVRLQEHKPAGKARFEDVKAQLQKELQQNKTNQLRAALDKKLRQNAKIEEL
ncbi:MAG TPA: peptidyl-prolyl cis-trans isomerase [Terracidiphilus sp.]|jgi:peptidyl-prolyl cis-trans isomerase C